MKKKSHKKTVRFSLITTVLFFIAPPAMADDYSDARAELVAAYQAEDFPAMVVAAKKGVAARPGHAGALFNLALAQVLNGREYDAMATLNTLADQKVDFGVADIDEFEPIRQMPDWAPYTEKVAALYEPVGGATIAYEHPVGNFVPEGIAVGEDGELFLGSIHLGDIIRIGETTETLVTAEQGRHWSVFGMRYDGDGTLWYVSSAMDEFAGLNPDDAGKSGLFAIDTATGEVTVRSILPATGNKQVLGDLIFADDDTIIVADQSDGVIYRYSISSGEFSTILERGHITSPQGIVLDEDGSGLYVADYVGGLYRVDTATGLVDKVSTTESVNDYGIDGLYRSGDRLIAIQNGIQPNRVVAMNLSDDGLSVDSARILAMNLPEFDDPNLGQVVGDEFIFIANSHWPQFNAEFELPEDLSGPIVMRVRLLP